MKIHRHDKPPFGEYIFFCPKTLSKSKNAYVFQQCFFGKVNIPDGRA